MDSLDKTATPFSEWQSPVNLEQVFAKPSSPNYLFAKDQYLYWQESLTAEKGRTVISRINYIGGYIENDSKTVSKANTKVNTLVERLTPKGFDVRTNANEYGGRAFVVGQSAIFFCNAKDQCIYQQSIDAPHEITLVTANEDAYFADLILSPDERFLFFVKESVTPSTTPSTTQPENLCEIAYVDLSELDVISEKSSRKTFQGIKPRVLISGADFYASLSFSKEYSKSCYQLAWIEWKHPNMPWDATQCKTATIKVKERLHEKDKLYQGCCALSVFDQITISDLVDADKKATFAHCQFVENKLLMTIDFVTRATNTTSSVAGHTPSKSELTYKEQNYANVYQWLTHKDNYLKSDGNAYEQSQNNQYKHSLIALTTGQFEYSYPHWIFSNSRYCRVSEDYLMAIGTHAQGDELHLIDMRVDTQNQSQTQALAKEGRRQKQNIKRLADSYNTFNHVCSDGKGNVFVLASKSTDETEILHFSNDSQTIKPLVRDGGEAACKREKFPIIQTSIPKLMLVNEGEQRSYAYYYPPKNADYIAPNYAPPLLVMVHGGPTARAYPNFDIQKQFWTTSGFAVLDINHRGSSGFGRSYRDALLGEWGVVDSQDILLAIESVIAKGLANEQAIYIRGKSAGGYAVQRALTCYPDMFTAGASYYGIGDLVTLARITHKFESHYCDRLLGEVFSEETVRSSSSRYVDRSPLSHIDQLKSPMILFQGTEDKVVPPELAKQVVSALKKAVITCDYHEYANEGHGFRSKGVLIDSLSKELAFYRRFMPNSSVEINANNKY